MSRGVSYGILRGHRAIFISAVVLSFFFFQAEDGIRDLTVTGVQTCALPISVMRDYCPDPARGERRAKRRDVGVPYHWLAPLVGRLREDLNRGRPDGIPPRGAQGYAALGRHVGAEQVVGCAFHVQGSSVNASREMRGTNRTPPARRSTIPAGPRCRMTSSLDARSPIRITRRPPGASCSVSGVGTLGAAAVTMMPCNGAHSGQPAAPSPSPGPMFA